VNFVNAKTAKYPLVLVFCSDAGGPEGVEGATGHAVAAAARQVGVRQGRHPDAGCAVAPRSRREGTPGAWRGPVGAPWTHSGRSQSVAGHRAADTQKAMCCSSPRRSPAQESGAGPLHEVGRVAAFGSTAV